MSTISEKLSRLDTSMSNIRASLNIDTSVPVEEVEVQVVNNNERVTTLENELYAVQHPNVLIEVYAHNTGSLLENHLIRVRFTEEATGNILYESPEEGEERNTFEFNCVLNGGYLFRVLSCKALDGSEGNCAVHPWTEIGFRAMPDTPQNVWLEDISMQGHYVNMSCMDDVSGTLLDDKYIADFYIEIYNETNDYVDRSFSTSFPYRDYFTRGSYSARIYSVNPFDGSTINYSEDPIPFEVVDGDITVTIHVSKEVPSADTVPIGLSFADSTGEYLASSLTIDFKIDDEWCNIIGGDIYRTEVSKGSHTIEVHNVWETDTGTAINEQFILPHTEVKDIQEEMSFVIQIPAATNDTPSPTKYTVYDAGELDALENVAEGSTAQVVRSSYNGLSFDEGTVMQGNIKMPDYADINNMNIDWSTQDQIVAEFSEEYLSRHFSVSVTETQATVTYANYDTGETLVTKYEGDGIWYNRTEGPDIMFIDKEMKVYNQSISDNYQVCSYFVQAETPIPLRDYTYTNGAWTQDATKVISINDYYSEIGDVLPAGTTLAFRRPASGTIVNDEGALMLDLQLTQYQDAQIRWSTPGTSTSVDGVYGDARWFQPQLEDMMGVFRDDMSLREKILLEFHNSLEDTSPEYELMAEQLEVLGDDLRDQIMLLRHFVPRGETFTSEEYTVQNVDTLWPEGFAYVTILAETQLIVAWSNDGVMAPVYKTFKDFFGVVVKADQPGAAIESEIQ